MSVLGAAAAVGSGLFNMFSQGKQNQKNRDFQAAENQKSRDYNTEMWNKNNAYNTPLAQMNRLREAGVNPHLAYSNGAPMNTSNAPASSNASSMPAGIAPQMDVNGLMMALRQKAEIDNIKADTQQKQANTEGTLVIADMNKVQLENLPIKLSLENQLMSVNAQVGEKNMQLTDEQIKKVQQEVVNLVSQDKVLQQQFNDLLASTELKEAEKQKVFAAIVLMEAQEVNLLADAELKREQSKTQGFIRSNLQSQTLVNTEKAKALARGNYIGEEVDLTNARLSSAILSKEDQIKLEQFREAVKNNVLKGLNIDHSKIDLMLKNMTLPASVLQEYKNLLPFQSTKTTNRFDSRGNYSGSTTTTTKRR